MSYIIMTSEDFSACYIIIIVFGEYFSNYESWTLSIWPIAWGKENEEILIFLLQSTIETKAIQILVKYDFALYSTEK